MADQSQGAYGRNGTGPAMMGGYGVGPGMTGVFGMGTGVISGYGMGSDMGPGMMGRYSLRSDLNLTSEQRSKISKIQGDLRRKHWDLMGKMQDEQALMNDQYDSNKRDDGAVSKGYRKMSEFRHQMFDLSLAAQSQIEAVLTKEQREKQRQR